MNDISHNKKLTGLQFVRVVAATSVVYLHTYIGATFGLFGVDIFFVLSGYVICLTLEKNKDWWAFLVARISRIFPLYFVLTSLVVVIALIFPKYVAESTAGSIGIGEYLKSIFFIPYRGATDAKPILRIGWTLNYEMVFYAFVAVGLLIDKTRWYLWTALMLLAVYTYSNSELSSLVIEEVYGNPIIIEFLLGFLAFWITRRLNLDYLSEIWYLSLAILCFSFMAFIELNGGYVNRLLQYGLPSMLIVVSMVRCNSFFERFDHKAKGLISLLGDSSYAMYLTHWFVVGFVKKVVVSEMELLNENEFSIVLIVIASQVVGIAAYIYLDKPLYKITRAKLMNVHFKY
jgi:exopolysaccharide production protein ExoZ